MFIAKVTYGIYLNLHLNENRKNLFNLNFLEGALQFVAGWRGHQPGRRAVGGVPPPTISLAVRQIEMQPFGKLILEFYENNYSKNFPKVIKKVKQILQTAKYNHITDAELLQNFYNDHDNQWLGILLPRYTLLLLGVCMKYLKNEEDAKDSVQQIFLKVINELHKYKVAYFKSWIYMIAKNHCLMKIRGNKNIPLELTEQILPAEELHDEKNNLIEKDRLLTNMLESIKQLNAEQQQCVTLFYLEKKSYAEVAEITGYSMLQVKSHLQNGKRKLKLLMKI